MEDIPPPLKVAVTVVFAVGMMLHVVPVPEHGPDQPTKVAAPFRVSVKVIGVPLAKAAEHVPGHWIPTGLLTTDPDPVPFVTTVTRIEDA
jgi:hypothetical protein